MRLICGTSLVLTTHSECSTKICQFVLFFMAHKYIIFAFVKTTTHFLSAPATRLWNSLPDNCMHPDHLYQENAVFSEVQQ